MKRIEEIYREILYQSMKKKNNILTQKGIAVKLDASLSTVNHALEVLKKMNSIKIAPRNFKVINSKKILYYWACIRNIKKDIIYETRVDDNPANVEKSMPDNVVYAAYSAYKFKFKNVAADYSTVYVYSNSIKEIEKRFPKNKNIPNLIVLKQDPNMNKYGKTSTLANIFVDLWNMEEWYAGEFLKELERKIG